LVAIASSILFFLAAERRVRRSAMVQNSTPDPKPETAVTDRLASSYPEHLAAVVAHATRALERGGFDHLLAPAGVETYRFLDDNPYPFHANPHFKWWVPLVRHPHSWIAFTPGAKPVLVYHQPADYWHVPPQDPAGWWAAQFDVRVIRAPADAARHLPKPVARCAILGEASAAVGDYVPNNPPAVLNSLHLARTRKSAYELECMRQASLRGAHAHRAAAAAFRERRSEFEIHLAFCEGAGLPENELPYGNIVALNEHGATLHYQHQERKRPAQHRSLLIDAGAQVHGYASDITRTYGHGDAAFTELLESVVHAQIALCANVRPGLDWRAFQDETHLAMARILRDLDVVRMEPASQVETGVSSAFFPHGVGHFIGLQVHDVGGFLKDESGATIPKPEKHPFLRCTRTLEADNVVTVEPGLYFIDMLLADLRAGPHAGAVNWAKVDHLRGFGGVRIEDNVRATDGEPENLTRDAFRALAA
jgi:Xaa-Pro dipeptidase